MESINKNMPLISCIIGLGILIFSIFHFIGGVRTELKADMAEVKSELKADMAEVRGEVREVRGEVREVRIELKADMASMETRFNTRMDRMEEKLDQLLQAQRKPASSKITKKPQKNPSS